MKKKVLGRVIACAVTGSLVLSVVGCGGNGDKAESSEKKSKVAIVYTVTGKGDLSFNDAACKGAEKAVKELGVELVEVEPTSLSDTEQAFEEMSADSDYDLIIGLTYEPLDAITQVAPNYPDQKYALIDTDAGQDNVESYIARENESAFMAGCFAALMTTSGSSELLNDENKIGIVAAIDADVINRHIAGYTCGAKYINPDIEVMSDYVGGFSDTAAAQAIAATMHNNGADIIYQVAAGAGLGVFKEAVDNNFMAIGLDDNQNPLYPDNIGMSTLKMVDEFVYTAIKDAISDSFKGGEAMSMGLKEGGVSYTLDGTNVEIPQEVKDTMKEIEEKIISGEIEVPNTKDGIAGFKDVYSK